MAITDSMMTDGGYDVTPTPVDTDAHLSALAAQQAKKAQTSATDTGLSQQAVSKLTSGRYNQLTPEERTAIGLTATDSSGEGGDGGDGSNGKNQPKTITGTKDNSDGTYTVTYSDGSSEVKGTKINGTVTDTTAYDNRVSAFNLLKQEFEQYGLGSLVDGIKGLIQQNIPASELSLRLRELPAYQQRFSANADRIKNGLSALSPAQYVALEDQYQNIMRNYGLPSSYYAETVVDPTTGIKRQTGFDKLIAGDVSASELENRIATAQQRVLNTNPEVLQALKQFYPDISNADILAYTLDPKNGLDNINRKVTAAEIGGAALQQGLQANGGTAESLAGQGITKAQAQQGFTQVAEMAPRGSQLAAIYGQQPYGQNQATAEVFNTTGAADAIAQRKKLTELEKASFSGSSGVGELSRDRKLSPYLMGQPGAGAY